MNKRNESIDSELRKNAEKMVSENFQDPKDSSMGDADALHELRVHQIELEMQNEELMKTQINLEDSRRKYFELYNFAPVGYFTLDKDGLILEVNIAGAELLGVERANLIKNAFIQFINPEHRKKFHNIWQSTIKAGNKQSTELGMIKRGGDPFYAQIESTIHYDELYKGLSIALLDITERKNAQNELLKLLEQKEILLKEIHHRVKNNLMIISSLMNLQSRYIKDKASKEIFTESQNRAKSMALIHERLYQSNDLKKIDFGEYIRSLSNELFNTYDADPGIITLKINVESLFLDINTAVPLGLIVNELISNCLKHGFPDGRKGEIDVDLHSNGNYYELSVKDNGIGFPKDLNYENTDSLGLQMIVSLTDQIDGNINLNNIVGTEFMITFKEFEVKKLN
jgi:two-component system, sensor histidine kinase PdtaS